MAKQTTYNRIHPKEIEMAKKNVAAKGEAKKERGIHIHKAANGKHYIFRNGVKVTSKGFRCFNAANWYKRSQLLRNSKKAAA